VVKSMECGPGRSSARCRRPRYSELVEGEGWTPAEYEAWLAGLLTDVLLPHH
jgi:hypothetical protein